MSEQPVIQVAVGIVLDHADPKRILLTQRPEGKVMASYWEFPGGKIEPGETPLHALTRELQEELDITVTEAKPFQTFHHNYDHGLVALHTFLVMKFQGEPKSMEDQSFEWLTLEQIQEQKILPANGEILAALRQNNIFTP